MSPVESAARLAGSQAELATDPAQPAADEPTAGRGAARARLHHVDAMRPVKQLGVVGTHSFAFFAPAAGYAVGASVMITHVTRFAFLFISAAMLVYAYPRLDREGIKVFWRRRLVAVALPYATWTLIYFLAGIGSFHSAAAASYHFFYLLFTGYYQLYYLLLLLELCVIYPGLLWFLRRTEGHHGLVLGLSIGLQMLLMGLLHYGLLAGALGKGNGMTELWNYEVFVVSGGLFAYNYERVHAWFLEHKRLILCYTLGTGLFAEGWVAAGEAGVPHVGGVFAAAVFQPAVMPFYLGLVACVYLLGVSMCSRRRSGRFRALLKVGVDDSYGIYLSQILVFQFLVFVGFRRLDSFVPWWGLTLSGIVIVFTLSTLLTSFLARLPGAKALAGRPRQPWRTLSPAAWRGRVQLLEASAGPA